MDFSIVVTCYNTRPVMERSVGAALETTGPETELILVNNHPPYPDVVEYLEALSSHPRVTILDPGHNLGCHRGQKYGLLRARGEYVVKLDDDIVVPPGWHVAMARALQEHPSLAYLALPWTAELASPEVRTGEQILEGEGYRVKVAASWVFFGCVMLKRAVWQEHFAFDVPGLYMPEDAHFFPMKAAELGMRFGSLISHPAQHLCRTPLTDPLYGVWKVLHVCGHPSTFEGDFATWRESFHLDPGARQTLLSFGYRSEDLDRWLPG